MLEMCFFHFRDEHWACAVCLAFACDDVTKHRRDRDQRPGYAARLAVVIVNPHGHARSHGHAHAHAHVHLQ